MQSAAGRIGRLVTRICPANDRPWFEAMCGELQAIEGVGPRATWVLGGACFLTRRHLSRITARLSDPVAGALVILGLFALVFGIAAQAEFEGLGIEDDIYPGLSAVCLVGVLLAAARLLSRKGATPPRFG
jgi:hypothetical protein